MTLRLAVTADLHWGHNERGDAATLALRDFLAERPPDLLVLAGDVGTAQHFAECLTVFAELPCRRALVPGNHDVWVVPDDPRGDLVRQILKDEGLELEQMKLKGFRAMFFSKGERSILCLPRELSASAEADDVHRGKMKWQLVFELPRGCYATLVVKRVTG